jgi:hypothetical protein
MNCSNEKKQDNKEKSKKNQTEKKHKFALKMINDPRLPYTHIYGNKKSKLKYKHCFGAPGRYIKKCHLLHYYTFFTINRSLPQVKG